MNCGRKFTKRAQNVLPVTLQPIIDELGDPL